MRIFVAEQQWPASASTRCRQKYLHKLKKLTYNECQPRRALMYATARKCKDVQVYSQGALKLMSYISLFWHSRENILPLRFRVILIESNTLLALSEFCHPRHNILPTIFAGEWQKSSKNNFAPYTRRMTTSRPIDRERGPQRSLLRF